MADERPISPPTGPSTRRILTSDEGPAPGSGIGSQFRTAPPPSTQRFSSPTPGIRRSATEGPSPGIRRRSSGFSDYSLNEARKTFQSSTDDLLLPKPSRTGVEQEQSHESSAWHSAPLAFALLPALGGMFFKNGSSVITDIMLLGLAAIFLNWSVRLPWNWYHSAQRIRKKEEYNGDTIISEGSEDDNALSFSQATLDEVPEDEQPPPKQSTKSIRRLPAHEAATSELYTHETLALLSCFLFPVLSAYLLHTIRSQLSRGSEGLVSNYNLTIFLLASELRPMAHLVKLIQSRTLHLQRVVNANPYNTFEGKEAGANVEDLLHRLEELEARSPPIVDPVSSGADTNFNGKQSAVLTTEVRRSLQPDLDALNRAVRRYEKRATLQAFQTESRLLDLEARLNDAISLAAAAANHGQRQRGFTGIVIEWLATAVVLPLQAFRAIASLPFQTIVAVIKYGKRPVASPPPSEKEKRKGAATGKYPSHGRIGDRMQGGRMGKR